LLTNDAISLFIGFVFRSSLLDFLLDFVSSVVVVAARFRLPLDAFATRLVSGLDIACVEEEYSSCLALPAMFGLDKVGLEAFRRLVDDSDERCCLAEEGCVTATVDRPFDVAEDVDGLELGGSLLGGF
jgi:hypothetical protein